MYERILAVIDGCCHDKRTCAEVKALAREHHASVRLIRALDPRSMRPETVWVPPRLLLQELQEEASQSLETARAVIGDVGVAVTSVTRSAGARGVSDVIRQEAVSWRADLVVISASARHWPLFLWRTAASPIDPVVMARRSGVSVLVVGDHDHAYDGSAPSGITQG